MTQIKIIGLGPYRKHCLNFKNCRQWYNQFTSNKKERTCEDDHSINCRGEGAGGGLSSV